MDFRTYTKRKGFFTCKYFLDSRKGRTKRMATFKDTLQLVDKVTQPLKKISDNTNKATGKLDRFKSKLSNISQGMVKIGGKFGKFAGKVAKVAMVVASSIGAIGGAVLRGAKQVADMGDRIDKMSQKIGMSRKAFQEWDYIMSQNGGNVETLQMGFKTLVTQIDGVRKGSKDSIRAFKELGVQVKGNNGQFRSADDIFNDVIRSLQRAKNPTEKMILANRLFGRSAGELRPLLNQEADAVDNLRQKANAMGLIISDEDVNNSVKFKDTMDTFTRFFQAKFATIMMKFMPEFSKMLEDLIQFSQENEEVFNNIGTSISWVVTKALPAVIKGVVWIANALKSYGALIGNIYGEIMSIPTNIYIAFNTLKTKIIIIFTEVARFIQGIIDGVKWVVGKIPSLRGSFGGGNTRIEQEQNNNVYNNQTYMSTPADKQNAIRQRLNISPDYGFTPMPT